MPQLNKLRSSGIGSPIYNSYKIDLNENDRKLPPAFSNKNSIVR